LIGRKSQGETGQEGENLRKQKGKRERGAGESGLVFAYGSAEVCATRGFCTSILVYAYILI